MSGKKSGMTRREFLNRIGQVGGSAAVFSAMSALGLAPVSKAHAFSNDTPLDYERLSRGRYKRKDVVILGAGIAGLTAAYELSRAGYNCVNLEARNRPGGRNETIRAGSVVEETDSTQVCNFDYDDQFYFNAGPARIPQHHSRILGYCREFGVPMEIIMNDNRGAYTYSANAYGNAPVRVREIHASLRGNISDLLAKSILRNALDDVILPEEKMQILAMLVQYGDLDQTTLAFNGTTRAGIVPGSGEFEPFSPLPPRDYKEFTRLDPFSQYKFHIAEYYDQQATMLQPVGGMDKIPYAFEQNIDTPIRYEHIITAIRRTDSGVRVEYNHNGHSDEIYADYAIVTIPPSVLRNIPNDFAPETQAAIAGVEYLSPGKVAFQSPRFWETDEQIYGGISTTDEDITQIWYPSAGFGQPEGIIVGAYIFGGPAGDNFAQLSPDQRIELTLSQGEKIHPNYRQYLKYGISRSWIKTPYTMGGWATTPPAPEFQQLDGPFAFAGDHTTYMVAWQEGAVVSAHKALDLISAQLDEDKA